MASLTMFVFCPECKIIRYCGFFQKLFHTHLITSIVTVWVIICR